MRRITALVLTLCIIAVVLPAAFGDGLGIGGIKIGDVGLDEIEDLLNDVFSSEEIQAVIAYVRSLGDDIYTTVTDSYDELSRQVREASDETLMRIIREELAKCNVTISDENASKLVSFVRKLASLDKDTFEKRVESVKKLIEKLGKLTEKIDSASEKVSGIMNPVKDFFSNLFGSFS